MGFSLGEVSQLDSAKDLSGHMLPSLPFSLQLTEDSESLAVKPPPSSENWRREAPLPPYGPDSSSEALPCRYAAMPPASGAGA